MNGKAKLTNQGVTLCKLALSEYAIFVAHGLEIDNAVHLDAEDTHPPLISSLSLFMYVYNSVVSNYNSVAGRYPCGIS